MSYDPARVCIYLSTVSNDEPYAHIPQIRAPTMRPWLMSLCLSLLGLLPTSTTVPSARRDKPWLPGGQAGRPTEDQAYPSCRLPLCARRGGGTSERWGDARMQDEISQLSSLWKRMSIISLEYKTQTTSRHAHTIKTTCNNSTCSTPSRKSYRTDEPFRCVSSPPVRAAACSPREG